MACTEERHDFGEGFEWDTRKTCECGQAKFWLRTLRDGSQESGYVVDTDD